jgi:hypothetical protein
MRPGCDVVGFYKIRVWCDGPHTTLNGNTPTPHSFERQAPTPLRVHTHGHLFQWSHGRAVIPSQKIKGGVGAPHVLGGVPTPPPLQKMRRGALPTTLLKDWLPPPLRLHVRGHDFAWSYDGEGISRSVIFKGGGGPSCARRGTHPSPTPKNEGGTPHPLSFVRQGTTPPSR